MSRAGSAYYRERRKAKTNGVREASGAFRSPKKIAQHKAAAKRAKQARKKNRSRK